MARFIGQIVLSLVTLFVFFSGATILCSMFFVELLKAWCKKKGNP